ncbi:hypothetical protein [Streptomyces coffeae]|uniref:Uncharacterized protein n=1 Tax=Streptomyces coffeae TaxID=621382 RepID=A0ABS1N538_9ACTN|nr:hypothetical protein [Streptomyces coffeae]MBL1095163.1 hypothetical protein [Streptomyces coffeae]
MSGTHTRPGPALIGDSLWWPLSILALVGLTPPAVILAGRVDAHGAPAPPGIDQPDAPVERAAADTAGDVDRAESHTGHWGWRMDWSVPRETVDQVLASTRPLDDRSRPRLRVHAAVLLPIVRQRPGACDDESVALAVKHLTEALCRRADMSLVAMAEAVEVLLDVVDPRGSPGHL